MLNEYNPQALEEFIDGSRSLNDWESVVKGIERYAHLFDVGAASYTRQHNDINEIRSYYWECMSQIVLYIKKDYNNAIDCSRRAIDVNRSNTDALVILCQILLTVSSKFLINNKNNNDLIETSKSNDDNDENYMKNIEYNSVILLQEILIDLPKSEQMLLLNILDCGSFTVKNCTLAVLNSLSLKDMKIACNDVLYAIRQPSRSRPSLKQLLRIWILSICKNLLVKISLNTVLMRYISDNMSDYVLWLLLDGVLTRIHILETLNDIHQARAEIINLLTEMISPFHSSFMKLPKRCKHMITMEAFRLPFLEMQIGMYDEAIESFKECTLDSGMYTQYAPILIRITHAVFAAVLLLKRAKQIIVNVNEYDEETSTTGIADIEDAFSLLSSAYKLLSMKVDLSHNNILSINDFYPSLSSLKLLLPSNNFDIDDITNMAVWSRVIGMLIVTIMENFKTLSLNIEEKNSGLDILEHCLTLDLHANSDYLWYIANIYKSKNKINTACDFLSQAHDAIVQEKSSPFVQEYKDIDLSLEYQDILKWLLPNKLLPSLHAWVPIVALADTLLNDANDPQKALTFAHKGLSLFSDRLGEEIIKFIESNQMPASKFLVLDGLGNQFNVSNILLMNSSIDLLITNHSSNSIDDQDLLGLYELVFLLGLCHRIISENRDLQYADKFKYSCLALKTFMLLHNSSLPNSGSKVLSKSKISLNYAICLLNVGEAAKALEIVDNSLVKSNSDDETISVLLHLKAILLCSENNISELFNARSVCEQAILKKSSINAKLTLALIDLMMGDNKKALENVEVIVDAATVPSRQILQWLHNEKTNTTRNGSRAPLINNQHDNSVDNITKKTVLIDLFLTCSYIFRKSGNISRAKVCLEEAWQLLYLVDNIENIVETSFTKDIRITTYHRRIDVLRKIPTMMGWKMFSGSGWGAKIDKHIEADILTEAGNILLSERSDGDQTDAIELFSFAISICPDHVPTLIALTNIEISTNSNLSRGEEMKITTDEKNMVDKYAKAFSLAVQAINTSPTTSMAWYILGKILEEMNMNKEAAHAYISVLGCKKYCNIRRGSIVDYDKFF